MRSLAVAVVGLLALAGSGGAAGDSQTAVDDYSLTLSPVALPVVADGKVVNYVFVTAKVIFSTRADEFALRDKEPFFRDALVRDAYRTPFVVAGDYNRIDAAKLDATLFRDAVDIAGPGAVRGVVVVSQAAQRFVRVPHAAP